MLLHHRLLFYCRRNGAHTATMRRFWRTIFHLQYSLTTVSTQSIDNLSPTLVFLFSEYLRHSPDRRFEPAIDRWKKTRRFLSFQGYWVSFSHVSNHFSLSLSCPFSGTTKKRTQTNRYNFPTNYHPNSFDEEPSLLPILAALLSSLTGSAGAEEEEGGFIPVRGEETDSWSLRRDTRIDLQHITIILLSSSFLLTSSLPIPFPSQPILRVFFVAV